jgi:plasmid stabilization system protein ParE
MTYIFLPDAQEELFTVALDFELEQRGLGQRFREEADRVVNTIVQNPLLWRQRQGGYRRVNFPIFPYYIVYVVRGQTIVIIAVAHGSRKPEYWKDRLR